MLPEMIGRTGGNRSFRHATWPHEGSWSHCTVGRPSEIARAPPGTLHRVSTLGGELESTAAPWPLSFVVQGRGMHFRTLASWLSFGVKESGWPSQPSSFPSPAVPSVFIFFFRRLKANEVALIPVLPLSRAYLLTCPALARLGSPSGLNRLPHRPHTSHRSSVSPQSNFLLSPLTGSLLCTSTTDSPARSRSRCLECHCADRARRYLDRDDYRGPPFRGGRARSCRYFVLWRRRFCLGQAGSLQAPGDQASVEPHEASLCVFAFFS